MKKAKNLKKRIRRLEARLQKGAKKLAKLKQKLEAPTQKKKQQVKPAVAVKKSGGAQKVKRKLNLTPERRAQLAETMRARWAAKRAAATNTQKSPSGPDSSPGDAFQPQ